MYGIVKKRCIVTMRRFYIAENQAQSFLSRVTGLAIATESTESKKKYVPAYLSSGTVLISTTLLAFINGSTTLLSFEATFAITVFVSTYVKKGFCLLGFRSNLQGDKKDKKAKGFDYVCHFALCKSSIEACLPQTSHFIRFSGPFPQFIAFIRRYDT